MCIFVFIRKSKYVLGFEITKINPEFFLRVYNIFGLVVCLTLGMQDTGYQMPDTVQNIMLFRHQILAMFIIYLVRIEPVKRR